MVSLAQLWLPILLSAVFVFLASSVIHMAFTYHNKEYHGLGNEDEVRAVLRKANAAPGLYFIPYCADMKQMDTPEMKQKWAEGPNVMLTVSPAGVPNMGPPVFRVVGCVAFLAYGFAYIPTSIWFKRPWSATGKDLLDALIYGLLTAGTFGWRWPVA